MNPILRNALAIVLGIAIGGAVNMGIVVPGAAFVPPPEGVDVTDSEALRDGTVPVFGAHLEI